MHSHFALGPGLLVVVGLFTGPATSQVEKPKAQDTIQARRAKILSIAERYRSHEWRASKKHRFHGIDKDGTRLDTPDESYRKTGFKTDGSQNIGIPYKWGGFTSIEEFDRGLERGLYAGHLPRRGPSGASSQALGVDCSGFVARCWNLPSKQSTRSLGHLCYPLDSYGDLLPGDALNSFDKHVMLFKSFVDESKTHARVVEAAGVRVRERVVSIAGVKKDGYLPLRYRPLDPRWVHIDFGSSTFLVSRGTVSKGNGSGALSAGSWKPARQSEEVLGLELISDLFMKTCVQEWARYKASIMAGGETDDSKVMRSTVSRAAARVQGDTVEIQERTQIGDRMKATSADHALSSEAVHWLMAFPAIDQAFEDMKVTKSKVIAGTYELGGRSFEAFRVSVRLEGKLLIRSRRYPVQFDVECFVSKEVPLYGILSARYDMSASFGKNARGEVRVRRMSLAYQLLDFCDPVVRRLRHK